jgi:hypothetical protein
MRSLTFRGVVLLIGTIAYASSAIAASGILRMSVPLGTITLRPPKSVTAKRVPVKFPHGAHFSMACNVCHHTWKGTTPITGCRAAGCHDLNKMPRIAKTDRIDQANAIRYYKEAYHINCIGCHKRMKQKIQMMAITHGSGDGKLPTTGPTGCIGCHPRQLTDNNNVRSSGSGEK